MKKILLTLVICTSVFLLVTARVHATEPSKPHGLMAYPALHEISLTKPGEEKSFTITYENTTNQPLNLQVLPVDFKQDDPRGGIDFLKDQEGSYSYSLSSFLTFQQDTLLVPAHGKVNLKVSVKNRQDLSPGGHYAAVIARVVDDSDSVLKEGSAHVSPSLSALVVLKKLGGERYHLALSSLDWPQRGIEFRIPQHVTATFQNEGNIHVIPYGELVVKDMFGRQIAKGVLNSGSVSVFPESRRYVPLDVYKTARQFPISFNSVHVKGHDSINKVSYVYTDSYIYVYPSFGIGVLFVGITLVVWHIRQKRRSS